MSPFRFACIATAVWTTSTWVQPLKGQESASDYMGLAQTFTCKPEKHGQGGIVATDLPRSVIVSVRIKDKKAAEFKVVYVQDDGTKTSPADETKSWHVVTIPGRRDYSWYGMANYHPNLLMHGRLFEQDGGGDGEKRWFYTEEQFEHGLKTVDYQTTCSKEG